MNPRNVLLIAAFVALPASVVSAAESTPDFNREIAPLLVKHCLECHNDTLASGNLKLTSFSALINGGDSGAVIEPGDIENSLLFDRIHSGEMPPEKKGVPQPLPKAEVELIRRWIESGAKWPEGRTLDLYEATNEVRAGRDWWSLQPIVKPKIPQVKNVSRIANPIDAFILARLEIEQMRPAPLADRRSLIRRVHYDMLGLPPTYEQVEAFLADESETAWENVVDRLLDSPHFGERWARHWLDLVRFAETCGYERDQEKPYAWKYRDWVVSSFNQDKPIDRFIMEQLAGDELEEPTEETLIGTGFLRLGTWNDEPNDPQDYKYERLEDMVHATASAFLGLTVKCARCHDHKFDPIPQADYYRMASAFWAGPIEPRDSKFLGGPTSEELGFNEVFGWTDLSAQPAPFHLLHKGDRHRPAQVIEPGSLTAVTSMARTFDAASEEEKTSQRRLQLARWIADPNNPLAARVFVNRLWQHHFLQGIVRTPNNFGYRGTPPTHPQLLEWLAAEFLEGSWKSKRIHKLILMSNTYQQSSLHPDLERYELVDSANHLLWRSERKRLDAESLRDSMLTASGELDTRIGGSSFRPEIQPAALEGLSRKTAAWQASPEEEQKRRSLYIYTKRGLLPPMMTTFDFTDTTLPCGQRDVTTVPTQALAMMNNQFTHARSTTLARRVLSAEVSKADQIAQAWRFALGRNPTLAERHLATEHLAVQKARITESLEALERPDDSWRAEQELVVKRELVLHLRADSGLAFDETQRVSQWNDLSGHDHHANQSQPELRPVLQQSTINGHPVVRFAQGRRMLAVQGQVLSSEQCTILTVVTDQGAGGHREIISNWNSDANTVSSVFLGLTGERTVRFSDAFGSAGQVIDRAKPFLLTAVNSSTTANIFQNATKLASQDAPLTQRRLDRPWTIGEQGNLQGETWNGDIAEILVYNRALDEKERQQVWSYLLNRYDLPSQVVKDDAARQSPELLALASLCHVLFNSNEFLYVD